MNDDERNLYEKLSEMFQEDASTVIDLPGNGYWTFVKKKTQIDLILELFLLDMNRIKQSICLNLLISIFSLENKQSSLTSLSCSFSGEILTMFQIVLRKVHYEI